MYHECRYEDQPEDGTGIENAREAGRLGEAQPTRARLS